ncbi:MAG: retropepsin-like aspartic protease family protein, partial [Candidatus Binatia bacterium]
MGRILGIILMAGMAMGFSTTGAAEDILLRKAGGVYEVPVNVNGVMDLHFIIDTGAAEVFIPADVIDALKRTKTVTQRDFLPHKLYTLADGSTVKSPRVMLRHIKIGSHQLENIQASVSQPGSPLLLGQSLLEKLGSYTVDNRRMILVVDGPR